MIQVNSAKGLFMNEINEQIPPFKYKVTDDFVPDSILPSGLRFDKRRWRVNPFRACMGLAIMGAITMLLAYFSGMLTGLSNETESGRTALAVAVVLGGLALQAFAELCWLAHGLCVHLE